MQKLRENSILNFCLAKKKSVDSVRTYASAAVSKLLVMLSENLSDPQPRLWKTFGLKLLNGPGVKTSLAKRQIIRVRNKLATGRGQDLANVERIGGKSHWHRADARC